ncbi:MAG TPA: hypothetical protein VFQ61_27295 [Polyangiaceae bacterium]|nr:hypothetical protein [Polyangiaceae bacterium]
MPADLDLVVRVDLERLRGSISPELFGALEKRISESSSGQDDEPTARWLLQALGRADTAWLAVRPGLAAELTDSVVVLRGRFADSQGELLAPPWGHGRDLGGTVLRFERAAPKLRASPALVVLRPPDRLLISTSAEIDALDRSLEGRGEEPLRAPESGLVSGAARLQLLKERLADRVPRVAKLLEGAAHARAKLDRTGERYPLELELTFETPQQAAEFAQAAERVRAALVDPSRAWLGQLQIRAFEAYVSLNVELSERDLLRAVACWIGSCTP